MGVVALSILHLGLDRAGELRRWLPLLVGLVSVAVVLTTLGRAPVAKADPADSLSAAGVTSTVKGAARSQPCSADGAQSREDRDCVLLQLERGALGRKGGKAVLVGKVRWNQMPSDAKAAVTRGESPNPSATVVIERAWGGGRWTDPTDRWKELFRTTTDSRGEFKVSVRMKNRGLYTLRARVEVASSGQTARQGATATSDVVKATAGLPMYGYVLQNDSSHDLNLRCQGQVENSGGLQTELADFSKGKSLACGIYGSTDKLSVGFELEQKNPIFGDPSTYKFVGYSNDSDVVQCKDMAQPKVKDSDVIKVSIKNAGFWGLGYTGTMTYPDGSACSFRMLTSTQDVLAGQPTWAKVLEITVGVVIIVIVVYFAATAIAAGSGGVVSGGIFVAEVEGGLFEVPMSFRGVVAEVEEVGGWMNVRTYNV